MLWLLRFLGAGVRCFDGIDGKYRQREQFAGTSDVLGAAGEQAIVADAMEGVTETIGPVETALKLSRAAHSASPAPVA